MYSQYIYNIEQKHPETSCNVIFKNAGVQIINSRGRFGFDRMFGENRLRVRALFTVINEQNKLNAKNDNVIKADFSRAYALAA